MLVKYVGPGQAILGETYILSGETREVTAGQFDQARANHSNHPEWFEEVGGEVVTVTPPATPPVEPVVSELSKKRK